MDNKIALIFIGIAAALWGIIGVFVTYLYEIGFSPAQVVTIRAVSATVFLLCYVLWKGRHLLRISIADSKYFIGTGILSFLLFNWCLFRALEETSMSVAFILLYTAPAFVMILSRLIFKELFTPRKVLALLMTFTGCAFVIGVLPSFNESVSLYGFLFGISSGLFYALYSIFGKFALKKFSPLTVTFYTFLFAAVAIIPFSGLWHELHLLASAKAWAFILGLGFFSTMLPFLLYTKGLTTVESSRASILATIEPVVATLAGFFVFQEMLAFWQYIGIFFVISAVIIVAERTKDAKQEKSAPVKAKSS